jgi:deleted-in-malignant-brain-tumors protein 1
LNSTLEDIHNLFGLTWIISDPAESLFTYSELGSWNTYYKPAFQPLFEAEFNNTELEMKAIEICGDNKLCLFDIAATGDLSIGEETLTTEQELETLTELFRPTVCDPPCVNGACVGNNTCFCSEGYEGDICNTTIHEECPENICLNGGTCQSFVGNIICTCVEGFSGPSCNESDFTGSTPTSTPDENFSLLIVGSTLGFLLLCTIIGSCIVTAILCMNKHFAKKYWARDADCQIYENQIELKNFET